MGQTDTSPLRATSSDAVQDLPHEVVAFRKSYACGHLSDWHDHPRHQLIHAVAGLMRVRTADANWVVPPGSGLLMPAGRAHRVRMVGDVRVETLYVARQVDGFDTPRMISVTPLLSLLIAALCRAEEDTVRNAHLRALALIELRAAPTEALSLPTPRDVALRRVCAALTADPANPRGLDAWAVQAGRSRRSFTRTFQAQTGLSFGQWRGRLRAQVAMTRLAAGEAETRVARDLGYASPYALRALLARMAR
ncbi:helix-turn-helix domain-containing protein [Jannaschia sp. M317]|uniref:AraC family transcriptional regulator n=1 Tax=Jannaschia sp. M317 TaxID=2867011 RepID=UPI0021A3BACE|nr:helix-turn-helix domain-containing protein [Jannaschia sp. M317]UWQ18406.1 helix-turn-helix domain-containing protein [Jannaschia sp. M317]